MPSCRCPAASAGGSPLQGAALTVEESTFFAGSAGPRAAMQIVLRGATFGNSEIKWAVERVREEQAA